jgi:hypothetical protein
MVKKLIRLTESDLHKIVKESAKRIMKEVALKGKSGKTYSLHGTDPESWAVMSRVRGKNGYFPNTPQHYHACRDEDNWIELDDKAHPNLRSRNNANRINAMMNRIDDKSKDIMAANESKLSRIVKESVNRILRESNRKEVFTISAFNIENEEDVSDMRYCGQTYYNIDDAIASATEFAQSLIDYGSVVMVTVYAGEYQTESGDIFGEPQDVYTISNSDRRTTAIARKKAGYVTDKVNDYAI